MDGVHESSAARASAAARFRVRRSVMFGFLVSCRSGSALHTPRAVILHLEWWKGLEGFAHA